jgi:hypothetical protein
MRSVTNMGTGFVNASGFQQNWNQIPVHPYLYLRKLELLQD